MTRLAITVLTAALLPLVARTAAADDDPQTYDFWLDPLLRAHPRNPKKDIYVDGDTLTIHVDPTRLFPDETKDGELGFGKATSPPDVKGFYVVGTNAGVATPISIQPGSCTNAKTVAQADLDAKEKVLSGLPATADVATKKAAEDAVAAAKLVVDAAMFVPAATPSFACVQMNDWSVDDGFRGYVCAGDKKLSDLVASPGPSWSVVQKVGDKLACSKDYTLGLGLAVSAVSAKVTNGANAPQEVTFGKQDGVYSASIPIKANTGTIVVSVAYPGGVDGDIVRPYTIVIQAHARDAHSPVRVQAEVLSTNRLRVISFAVAVSPVSHEYFTKGPLSCVFGCALTAVAALRMSGEDHTVVQFGFGVGLNLAKGFQLNGGLLFGAADASSAWRPERTWFVGLAIDPVILAEVMSQSGNTKK
ncbi:MAG: hypothetical protein JWO36_3357 [Myxococcales bacterium]|nr:hypothetical protein [Myxococcales bacterium]